MGILFSILFFVLGLLEVWDFSGKPATSNDQARVMVGLAVMVASAVTGMVLILIQASKGPGRPRITPHVSVHNFKPRR